MPAGLFRPGADLEPLLNVGRRMAPAALRRRTPALIVQDGDDPVLAAWRTDRVTRSLSARGATVDYHVYPGIGQPGGRNGGAARTRRILATRTGERPQAAQWRTSTRGG